MEIISKSDPCYNIKFHDNMNVLINIILQILIYIYLSKMIYAFIRPLGQPIAVAQMLVGFILGRSGLWKIHALKEFVMLTGNSGWMRLLTMIGRIVVMFFVGLEFEAKYLYHTKFKPAFIALGGSFTCAILAIIFSNYGYWQTRAKGSYTIFTAMFPLILANSSAPVVASIATDLKIATSDVGQIAISAAIVNDIACLFILAMIEAFSAYGEEAIKVLIITRPYSIYHTYFLKVPFVIKVGSAVFSLSLAIASTWSTRMLIQWLNHRYKNRKELRITEFYYVVMFVLGGAMMMEMLGYNSMIMCFAMGAIAPREGRATRTLIKKLSGPVNNVIFPIYYASLGLRSNIWLMGTFASSFFAIFTICLLSIGGKVLGTLAIAHYFYKMSTSQGLVLGCLLNLKGHVAVLLVEAGRNLLLWKRRGFSVIAMMMLTNTILIGPLVKMIIKHERKVSAYQYLGLEWQTSESDLRILACVHSAGDLPAMTKLIEVCRGMSKSPQIAFIMHLVELTHANTVHTHMFYHQKEEEYEDYEDYGGEDERLINNAIDAFTKNTGISVRQLKAISNSANMYEDICNGIEDTKAALVLLPFHKRQRSDGKKDDGKEGHRLTNQNVLSNARCTVGILVDRGLSTGATQSLSTQAAHHIATLFVGGPHDREALAFAGRIAEHPNVSLTVIRLLPKIHERASDVLSTNNQENNLFLSMLSYDKETDTDQEFLSTFHGRYVLTGIVSYVEKFVKDGAETLDILRDMNGVFSLFILGKGENGLSPLTGIGDWIEFSELGAVGDLLASSDFAINASVLVIQQYNPRRSSLIDDDFVMHQ